jgi:hypothetical protein
MILMDRTVQRTAQMHTIRRSCHTIRYWGLRGWVGEEDEVVGDEEGGACTNVGSVDGAGEEASLVRPNSPQQALARRDATAGLPVAPRVLQSLAR